MLFVRGETLVVGESREGEEELVVSVEEIRMRWESMSMVNVFKRVRM